MKFLAGYVITVSSASIVVGVILALVRDTMHESLIKLLCGIFLTITAVSPVCGMDMDDVWEYPESCLDQAEQLVMTGENLAAEARSQIIKQKTEAYILDKSTALKMDLDVDVHVSDGVPNTAYLKGDYTESQRQILTGIITEELGIPKENQQWIGIN